MAARTSVKGGVKRVARKPRLPAGARERALRTCETLAVLYPDATCELNFKTPFELLVATILSAQCTDQRVNLVTKDLFRKYRSPADYAAAPPGELEADIRSTGFFNNKARSIRAASARLIEKFKGRVPRTTDEMLTLPGVARKTANVVLGTAYGIPTGITVDTHVQRLSRRLGLTRETDPEKIERQLMELLPEEEWIDFGHRLIWHGRRVCHARKPNCAQCALASFCPKVGVDLE
jgi:endonuclease III